jgi:hypothetical protein
MPDEVFVEEQQKRCAHKMMQRQMYPTVRSETTIDIAVVAAEEELIMTSY